MARDIDFLMSKKQSHQKITMLTCYDFPTALLEDKAGIDIIFVADSVGTNVLGYESATEVTMEDMIHHLKAVRRGVTDAYLLVDMPYKSYDTPKTALENARTFLSHGADGVKLEGWSEKEDVIKILAENNIEVCAHIGYNPQIHSRAWTHGVTFSKAKALIQSASTLENAGARMIVLEMVSEEVSKIITEKLSIPTIGIAAGKFCDGQVLVINDMLGITPLHLRHTKKYQRFQDLAFQAICQYKEDVENGLFPAEANTVSMDQQKLTRVEKWLGQELDAVRKSS